MDWHEFSRVYCIDQPAKERFSCDLALDKDCEGAIRTLARSGHEHLRIVAPPMTGRTESVFVLDVYEGKVGTVDVRPRQPLLFDDALERWSAREVAEGLAVLERLPAKGENVQSLEEFEAHGPSAKWHVVFALARLAEARPGSCFRFGGHEFELPKHISVAQSEFVSEKATTLENCFVADVSKEHPYVQLVCSGANAVGLPQEFRAFITSDNVARDKLDLARVLNMRVDVVRVRRVRTLSQRELCAQVEGVEVNRARVHAAIDGRLATQKDG